MWTMVLWLSLGITLGVTGSTIYSHLTQQVAVSTVAPPCAPTIPDATLTEQDLRQGNWQGSPQGRFLGVGH